MGHQDIMLCLQWPEGKFSHDGIVSQVLFDPPSITSNELSKHVQTILSYCHHHLGVYLSSEQKPWVMCFI